MALIFDNFSADHALAFGRNTRRKWVITNDPSWATDIGAFPFETKRHVVLIQRNDEHTGEDEIIASVKEFGGQFAGT